MEENDLLGDGPCHAGGTGPQERGGFARTIQPEIHLQAGMTVPGGPADCDRERALAAHLVDELAHRDPERLRETAGIDHHAAVAPVAGVGDADGGAVELRPQLDEQRVDELRGAASRRRPGVRLRPLEPCSSRANVRLAKTHCKSRLCRVASTNAAPWRRCEFHFAAEPAGRVSKANFRLWTLRSS